MRILRFFPHTPSPQPSFDRFESLKGGIETDGYTFHLYGERTNRHLQRTPKRTAAHLAEPGVLDAVKAMLNAAPSTPPPPPDAHQVLHDLHGTSEHQGPPRPAPRASVAPEPMVKRSKVDVIEFPVAPEPSPADTDDFAFTGILSIENAIAKGIIGHDFFDNRTVLDLDPGGKYALAGEGHLLMQTKRVARRFRVTVMQRILMVCVSYK